MAKTVNNEEFKNLMNQEGVVIVDYFAT